ncbi:hypothetical protein ACSNOI_46985, partial [Actinomadura kijaniata]
ASRSRHWRWMRSSRKAVSAVLNRNGDAWARCPVCGTEWVIGVERQSSAIYCSVACRVRAYAVWTGARVRCWRLR